MNVNNKNKFMVSDKSQYEIIFLEVLSELLKIDNENETTKAISRLLETSEYLDLDNFFFNARNQLKKKQIEIEPIQKKNHKKWSLEKLCAFFLNQSWEKQKYESGIQWYLITGLVFQLKGSKIEILENKRDIKTSRVLVNDMNLDKYTVNEGLIMGVFGDWWCKPLEKLNHTIIDNEETKKALEVLRGLGPNGQKVKKVFQGSLIKIENVKELREGEWLGILLNSKENIFSDLVNIISQGNKCNALISSVILHFSSKNKRKTLPLSIVAIPLLDMYHDACMLSINERKKKWLSPKFIISPKGDLWEWMYWLILDYGNRLEPILTKRIDEKIKNQILPYEFYLLADLVVFHKDLNTNTYKYLSELVSDIITQPNDFKNWFDFDFLKAIYRNNESNQPDYWDEFLRITSEE